MTYAHVLKYNTFHDKLGRFASSTSMSTDGGGGAGSVFSGSVKRRGIQVTATEAARVVSRTIVMEKAVQAMEAALKESSLGKDRETVERAVEVLKKRITPRELLYVNDPLDFN